MLCLMCQIHGYLSTCMFIYVLQIHKLLLLCQTGLPIVGFLLQVQGNVEAVFCKFLDQGKANIRLKEPNTDVLISKVFSIIS